MGMKKWLEENCKNKYDIISSKSDLSFLKEGKEYLGYYIPINEKDGLIFLWYIFLPWLIPQPL